MLVSFTRLRVRSLKYLPAFLWQTFRSQRQVVHASGFSGGRLLVDSRWTFWTLTLWETDTAMKGFRGAATHGKVMRRLPEWCDEASYAHWLQDDDIVPSWPAAHERLMKEGRLSRVEHPSSDHTACHFPLPRLKPLIGQDLRPTGAIRRADFSRAGG